MRRGKEQFIHRLLPKDDAFYLGAFEPGLVGMVYFRRDEGIKNQHKGYILSMYVRPESRGLGIGKALLQEVIIQAKRLSGLEQLHLSVVISNEAARSLYRAMGFEVFGTILQAMKENEQYWDEELMVLRLQ